MLSPKTNRFRHVMDLGGFWRLRPDLADEGLSKGWSNGFHCETVAAVPASWNDQIPALRDFLGPAWYSNSFVAPEAWRGGKLSLHFDSVNYRADVWLNGNFLGFHEGGHLPFCFDVTGDIGPGENLLVVRVDGTLSPDRVPPGNVPPDPLDSFVNHVAYPAGAFDFFPFCGIQRPVRLCLVPQGGIEEIHVATELSGGPATVRVDVRSVEGSSEKIRLTLSGHGVALSEEAALSAGSASVELSVPAPRLWSCDSPSLYTLVVEQIRGGNTIDAYSLPVGIRSIAVEGDRLLLNGRPIFLRGFGRHEDFPISGRGYQPAVMVRDFEAMKWTGANSFRTTHYPYAEETLDLADRLGFLVIDEIPAVGLFFSGSGLTEELERCKSYVRELIARDRNHPSVIAWNVANEPHSLREGASEFLRELYALAKSIDPSRLALVVSWIGEQEKAFSFTDLVCINRYLGWYSEFGRLEEGCEKLSRELDTLHEKYRKPILLSEFGADAIAGAHADPPEMFSEEYQARMIERYIEISGSKPYIVGQHVWNLCDFKTGQALHRPYGMNHKGVFTRDRKPKMAAHLLRRLWGGQ